MDGLLRLLLIVLIIVLAAVLRGRVAPGAMILEYQRGILYRKGRYVRLLDPGRHRIWKPVVHESATIVDMRLRSLVVTGQDILTKDQINIKLSLVAQYRILDPVAAYHKLENVVEFLHQELQLAVRSIVSAYGIDQLFEAKADISKQIADTVQAKAHAFGIEIVQSGVRDVILPGEIKNIMAKAVEAEKAAKAALITAREELATARTQANTARLIQENPVILKLKELQAMVDATKKGGSTIIFAPPSDLRELLKATPPAPKPAE